MERESGNSPKYMKVGELAEQCVDGTDEQECETSVRYKTRGSLCRRENSSSEMVGRSTSHEDGGDGDSGISEPTGDDPVTTSSSTIDRHRETNTRCRCTAHGETLPIMIIQIVIPFFFAGFGMMAAGLVLDTVQVSYPHSE